MIRAEFVAEITAAPVIVNFAFVIDARVVNLLSSAPIRLDT